MNDLGLGFSSINRLHVENAVEDLKFDQKFLENVFLQIFEEEPQHSEYQIGEGSNSFYSWTKEWFPWQCTYNFVKQLPQSLIGGIVDVPFSALAAITLRDTERIANDSYFSCNANLDFLIWEPSRECLSSATTLYSFVDEKCQDGIQRNLSSNQLQFTQLLEQHPEHPIECIEHFQRAFKKQESLSVLTEGCVTACIDFAFSSSCNDLYYSENKPYNVRELVLGKNLLNSQGRCAVTHSSAFVAVLLRQVGLLDDIVPLRDQLYSHGFAPDVCDSNDFDENYHLSSHSNPQCHALQQLVVGRMKQAFLRHNNKPIMYVPFPLIDFALNGKDAFGKIVNKFAHLLFMDLNPNAMEITPPQDIRPQGFANYFIPSSVVAQLYVDRAQTRLCTHFKQYWEEIFEAENNAQICDFPSTGMFQLLSRFHVEQKQRFSHDCTYSPDIYFQCLKAFYSAAEIIEIEGGIVLLFRQKRVFTILLQTQLADKYECPSFTSSRFTAEELERAVCVNRCNDLGCFGIALQQLSLYNITIPPVGPHNVHKIKKERLRNHVIETQALMQLLQGSDVLMYNSRFAVGAIIKQIHTFTITRAVTRKLLLMIVNVAVSRRNQFIKAITQQQVQFFGQFSGQSIQTLDLPLQLLERRANQDKLRDLVLYLNRLELWQFFSYLNWQLSSKRLSIDDVAQILYILELTDERKVLVQEYFDTLQRGNTIKPQPFFQVQFLDEIKGNLEILSLHRASQILSLDNTLNIDETNALVTSKLSFDPEALIAEFDNPLIVKIYNVLGMRPLLSYHLSNRSQNGLNDVESGNKDQNGGEVGENVIDGGNCARQTSNKNCVSQDNHLENVSQVRLPSEKAITWASLKASKYFSQKRQSRIASNLQKRGFARFETAQLKQMNETINNIKTDFLDAAYRVFLLVLLQCVDCSDANSNPARGRIVCQYIKILLYLSKIIGDQQQWLKVLNQMLSRLQIDFFEQLDSSALPTRVLELLQHGVYFFSFMAEEQLLQLTYESKAYQYFRAQQKSIKTNADKEIRKRAKMLANQQVEADEVDKVAKGTFADLLTALIYKEDLLVSFKFDFSRDQIQQFIGDVQLVAFDQCCDIVQQADNQQNTGQDRSEKVVELQQKRTEEASEIPAFQEECSLNSKIAGQIIIEEPQKPENGLNEREDCIMQEQQVDNKEVVPDNLDQSADNIGIFWFEVGEQRFYPDVYVLQNPVFPGQAQTGDFHNLPPGLKPKLRAPYYSLFKREIQFSNKICFIEEECTFHDVAKSLMQFIGSTPENRKYLPLTSYHFLAALYDKPVGTIFLPFVPTDIELYQVLFTSFPEIQLLITDYCVSSVPGFSTERIELDADYCQQRGELVLQRTNLRNSIPTDFLSLIQKYVLDIDLVLSLAGRGSWFKSLQVNAFVPRCNELSKTIYGRWGSVVRLPCDHCFEFVALGIPLAVGDSQKVLCPKCRLSFALKVTVPVQPSSGVQTEYQTIFGHVEQEIFLQCGQEGCWLVPRDKCGGFDQFYHEVQ